MIPGIDPSGGGRLTLAFCLANVGLRGAGYSIQGPLLSFGGNFFPASYRNGLEGVPNSPTVAKFVASSTSGSWSSGTLTYD